MRITVEGFEDVERRAKLDLLEDLGVNVDRLVEQGVIGEADVDEVEPPELAKACCCCCCPDIDLREGEREQVVVSLEG